MNKVLTSGMIYNGDNTSEVEEIRVAEGSIVKIQAYIPSGSDISCTIQGKLDAACNYKPMRLWCESGSEDKSIETITITDDSIYSTDVAGYYSITASVTGVKTKGVKIYAKILNE